VAVNPTLSEDHANSEAYDNEPAVNPAVAGTVLSGTDSEREYNGEGEHEELHPDSKLVERDFFNAQDGLHGRSGGVYLDMQERNNAETVRAMQEGREPDYDNPPATAGTQLVVEGQRVANPYSNPSAATVPPVTEVDPVATVPVDVGVATADVDRTMAEQYAAEAEAAGTTTDQPTGEPNTTLNSGANEPLTTQNVGSTTEGSGTAPGNLSTL